MCNIQYLDSKRTRHATCNINYNELLAYKAIEAGCSIVAVNVADTPQACSGCGCMVPKKLRVRIHHCPDCV